MFDVFTLVSFRLFVLFFFLNPLIIINEMEFVRNNRLDVSVSSFSYNIGRSGWQCDLVIFTCTMSCCRQVTCSGFDTDYIKKKWETKHASLKKRSMGPSVIRVLNKINNGDITVPTSLRRNGAITDAIIQNAVWNSNNMYHKVHRMIRLEALERSTRLTFSIRRTASSVYPWPTISERVHAVGTRQTCIWMHESLTLHDASSLHLTLHSSSEISLEQRKWIR